MHDCLGIVLFDECISRCVYRESTFLFCPVSQYITNSRKLSTVGNNLHAEQNIFIQRFVHFDSKKSMLMINQMMYMNVDRALQM